MKLLDPNEVKDEKNRSETERMARIRSLVEEERKLTKIVNDKHDSVKTEIAKLDEKLGAHINYVASEKVKLDAVIEEKTKEVEALENRKKEALKPIDELKNEAENRIKEVEKREADIARGESHLAEAWTELSERIEDVTDRETANTEKTEDLDKREKKVIESENRIKLSSEKLSGEWLKFHQQVHDANVDLAIREKKVSDREKTNSTFFKSLCDKETDLDIKDKQLKDGFATLERSKQEIATGKRPKS